MQAAHGSFSSGSALAEGATGASGSAMRASRPSSGGSSGENPSPSQQAAGAPAAAAAPSSWNKVKARIVAEAKEQHGARAANEPDARLQEWLAEAGAQCAAADAQFQAAKAEFQQADAARAAARDAFRADSKNSAKSAEWHGAVQRTGRLQERMRAAREGAARAQALAELLQGEVVRRGLQVPAPPAPNATAAAAAAAGSSGVGAKRKRRAAPVETCPFCDHTYTVRDGLSSKLDAEGNRMHLRRCQCREKTPPCKNCPHCKTLGDLMSVSSPEEQLRLCQGTYRCQICSCRCPGAGKWIEADAESRRAFAQRTEQRFGQLSAMGWGGGAAAAAAAVPALASTAPAPSATTTGAGGAGGGVAVSVGTVTAELGPEAGQSQSRGGTQQRRRSTRSLKRLPADIRSELEQAQQELSTADVLRGWCGEREREEQAQQQRQPAQQQRQQRSGRGRSGAAAAAAQQAQHARQHAQQHAEQHAEQHSVRHFHTCSHPHNECTSECCSAAGHAPGLAGGCEDAHADCAAFGHHHHQFPHHPHARSHPLRPLGHGHSHSHVPDRGAEAAAGHMGSSGASLPTLAAIAVAAQQAQHAAAAATAASPLLAGAAGAGSGMGGMPGDLMSATALQLMQQMMAAGGVPPPPELPEEVTSLVDQVFLHAAGQHGVSAVRCFLRSQRVTSLSDLEYMELSWLCQGLEPAGLPPLLLNKFLQLGRRQAASTQERQHQEQQQQLHDQQQQQHQQQPATAAAGAQAGGREEGLKGQAQHQAQQEQEQQ